MTMTRDKIAEQLAAFESWYGQKRPEDDPINVSAWDDSWEAWKAATALAERALEPQGQALPELPNLKAGIHTVQQLEEMMREYGQKCFAAGRLSPALGVDHVSRECVECLQKSVEALEAKLAASQLALPAAQPLIGAGNFTMDASGRWAEVDRNAPNSTILYHGPEWPQKNADPFSHEERTAADVKYQMMKTSYEAEIKQLRERLALPAGPVPTDAEFDALRAAAIEACTWLDHSNCVNLPVDDDDPDTSMRASMNKLRDLAWKTPRRSASPAGLVPEAVGKITGADEYGPMIEWCVHWADLVGRLLYVAPSPAVAQPVGLPLPKKTGKWESDRVADYNAGWNACRVQYLLAQPAVAQPMHESIITKERQCLALWQAIKAIKFGSPTDDKLIVSELHKAGYYIAKVTSPAVAQPVADERVIGHLLPCVPELTQTVIDGQRYCFSGAKELSGHPELRAKAIKLYARAALCQPAEEGGKV